MKILLVFFLTLPTLSFCDSFHSEKIIDMNLMKQFITSWIGTPYVKGGNTKRGIDCSGFTRKVYQTQNITIPRTSFLQFRIGSPVEKDNLQFGDLVFFRKSQSSQKINHVGIYIGNTKFAHANSKQGVTVTSINSSKYLLRYAGARRIADKINTIAINQEEDIKTVTQEKDFVEVQPERKDKIVLIKSEKSFVDQYYENISEAHSLYLK